ncbi:MAG: protein-disulfide reductase DsbD domain-containing protein [Pseudomonadota bacterium]
MKKNSRNVSYTLFFSLFGSLCINATAALDTQNVLPAEQAFQVQATPHPQAANSLLLRFVIAPGYYLYRDKIHFESNNVNLPPISLPSGETKTDAVFGKIAIFRNVLSIPVQFPQKLNPNATLTLRLQGCADIGVCYPPATHTVSIASALKGEKIKLSAESSSEQPSKGSSNSVLNKFLSN